MNLLDIPLPELRLRIDVDPSSFFDSCEDVAEVKGWAIDRRRQYAGPGYDQLNLHIGVGPGGYPILRMVATPKEPQRLFLDVVHQWTMSPLDYDEYLDTSRRAYATLLREYRKDKGSRCRLGVPRRPVAVDYAALNCGAISYAAEKLGGLCRSLAIGAGDARDRLISAHWSFHVIRPNDLPEPLGGHLAWVYSEITKRPARHQWEGSVESTVRTMRKATAARILERLVDIADGVERLDRYCRKRRAV